MRTLAGVVCLVALVVFGGCNRMEQDRAQDENVARAGTSAPGAAQGQVQGTQVTGTIRHIDLEGGFYGIETDDGAKLDPVNLPPEFQHDGLRIRATVEELKDRISFHMWGRQVRILSIERL